MKAVPETTALTDGASPAEFDAVAADYRSLVSDSLRGFGGGAEHFAEYKVSDVARHVGRDGIPCARILDFGAGVGESVAHFRRLFPKARLTCADVSSESLEIARRRFSDDAEYRVLSGTPLPFADDAFDIVFAACVFHHVPPADHAAVLNEMLRILCPKGRLFLFEHNPLNPLTVRVVRRCPVDANAVLVGAAAMRDRLVAAGFEGVSREYRVFFPAPLRALRPLERALGWCALGGQYLLKASKPAGVAADRG